jgi:hypothetical protein
MLDFPVEYALVVFPGNQFSGEIVPALLDLAERDIIRFVDIVFVQKEADGNIRTVELNDLDEASYKLFVPLGKQIDSLFTEDDLDWAAGQMPENSSAALFLWENLWMGNIRDAIVNSGGILAERGQIPEDVIEQFKNRIASEKAK